MGLFSSKRKQKDWSIEPINRVHDSYLLDTPDMVTIAANLRAMVDPDVAVNIAAAAGRLCSMCHLEADQCLRALGHDDLADATHVIVRRPDFNGDMLFDFLTMQDAHGIAVYNKVVGILRDEELLGALLASMRRGECV